MIQLERDSWGKLILIDDGGRRHAGIVPVRGFPISDPHHFVSICDAAGHELVCIENVADLPSDTRQLLEDDLATRDFIPVITRVHHISSLAEPCAWDVETDRGRTQFVLKSEDDVRRLTPHRAFIIDSHGIRYLIRDARELDATSRRFVEWYL